MISIEYPSVTEDMLTHLVQKIVETFHPEKVILFGSYAWGIPRPDSVSGEEATGEEAKEALDLAGQIRAALRIKLGLRDDVSAERTEQDDTVVDR